MLFHTMMIWKSSVVLGDGSFNGCLADLLLFSAVNSLNSFLCLLSWGWKMESSVINTAIRVCLQQGADICATRGI